MEKNTFGKTFPKEIFQGADEFAQIAGAYPYLRKVIDVERVYGLLSSVYLMGVRDGKSGHSGIEDEYSKNVPAEVQEPDAPCSSQETISILGKFTGFLGNEALKKELEKETEEFTKERNETK